MEKKYGWWIALLCIFCLGACDDEEEGVTCATSIENFYDNYCLIAMESQVLTESQAQDQCEGSQEAAVDLGCTSEFDAALKCMHDVDSSNADSQDELSAVCSSCTPALATASDCMTTSTPK